MLYCNYVVLVIGCTLQVMGLYITGCYGVGSNEDISNWKCARCLSHQFEAVSIDSHTCLHDTTLYNQPYWLKVHTTPILFVSILQHTHFEMTKNVQCLSVDRASIVCVFRGIKGIFTR